MAMTGQLRVTPQELINTASDFNSKNQTIKSITSEMLNLVAGLNSFYEGDAATAYMKKFAQLSEDMNQIYRKIEEHSTDLQEMAQTYIKTEDAETASDGAMNSNLIE